MNTTPLLEDAIRLQQAGRIPEAAQLYSQVLQTDPRNYHALYQLGLILFEYRRYEDADRFLGAAIRVNSGSAELFYSRGCVLQQLGRTEDALAAFAHALAIRPDFPEARNNRGVTLLGLGRPGEALGCFDRILLQHPDLAIVHTNRANALLALKRPDAALESAESALRLNPNLADAHFNCGSALVSLGRNETAHGCFERALKINPQHADALIFRGIVLELLERPADALESYNAALSLRPEHPDILFNRTSTLMSLGRYRDVVTDCDKILKASPHFKYAAGMRLYAKLHACDWDNRDPEIAEAVAAQRAGYPVLQPLQAVAMLNSGEVLLQSSRIWVGQQFPAPAQPLWRGETYRHGRIRVAYVSGDFGEHPVMTLTAGVFEQHDRAEFEITAISTRPCSTGPMRQRLHDAFDRFIDLRNHSAREIAQTIRNLEVDIVVDLMGHTQGAPTPVFAQRAAPVQVTWLGFPGSSGAPYMDYIIADRIVIPDDQQNCYSEKVAWLPRSCFPVDNKRALPQAPSRQDAGLPETGFVFCNFGKPLKFAPHLFALWMRLLKQIPDSSLWLAQHNSETTDNLQRAAEAHGVARERFCFAPFLDSPDAHLARIVLADLYLDTFPYNAHATACDFLWAGVPVLTLTGGGYPGRAGASILSAAGLDSLITHSPGDYEQRALQLANDPGEVRRVKDVLAGNRSLSPLFDTPRFTRNLERAYTTIWRRHESGAAPESFAVDDSGAAS